MLELVLSIITLTILEIILGIDNLVFLSILSERLPVHQRKKARRWGLTFAWITRLILLASAVWIAKLTYPLLTIMDVTLSIRDVFLLGGGTFLIAKATQEIHQEVIEEEALRDEATIIKPTFFAVVSQIALMDIIFSLDSVLTAIGLTNNFYVMALAITIAIIVMIFASEPVSRFIERFPSIKMLALSFLILIGMVLIADSFAFHIPRGYIYFSMGFSLGVESLNLIKYTRKQKKKIK